MVNELVEVNESVLCSDELYQTDSHLKVVTMVRFGHSLRS
jgi:hypothetical protein